MAKLNKTVADAVIQGRIPGGVVGVYRRLERTEGKLTGKLHGYAVVTRAPDRVIIRHFGLRNRTTLIAMNDFFHLMGLDAKVSFAGKKFQVVLDGVKHEADDAIEIVIPAKCGIK